MKKRAFYRVPIGSVTPGASESDFDVRVLLTLPDSLIVMAPEPRPKIAKAMGAKFLGFSWKKLYKRLPEEERNEIFLVRVKRDSRVRRVPIADLLEGEEVRAGPIPPTRYLGDPPPRPLRFMGRLADARRLAR